MKKLLTFAAMLMMAATISAQVTFTCTAGMKYGDGEGVQKMFDGSVNTKFTGSTGDNCYALFTASTPVYVWGYDMTTGNDTGAYGRCVRKWKLYGTNDETVAADASSSDWTLIDEVTENNSYVQQINYYKQRFFCQTSATGTAYKYFKLLLTDGGFVQLSEFSLCCETYPVVNYEWFESDGGDGSKKAVDGKLNQKWEGQTALVGKHLTIKTSDGQPHSVKSYSLTTHDDYDWNDRAPKEWRIEGSNDNSTWVTIAEVTGGNPIKNMNYTTYEFIPDNTSDAFTYIKLTLTSMKANGYQQLGEFHVVGGCTTHTWQANGTVAATCISKGGDEYVCTVCGTKKLENATDKAAHDYVNGICSVCGDYQSNYVTKNGDYYEPTTAAHFTWLAAMMKETEQGSFKIRLTQDVDLTGFGGFSCGDRALRFKGEFDGQGHWLNNFSLTGVSDKNVAFFGKTDGANIHDLGFGKANVRSIWSTQNTAIIAGNANNTTFNRIAVMNGSYVEGYDHVGSIAGNTQGNTNISNCISNADVYSMQYQAGGFVGTATKLTLQKSLFLGTVRCGGGVGNVGGLVSLWENDDAKVLQNNVMAATAITTAKTDVTPLVSTNGKTATYANNRVAASTTFKSTNGSASEDLKAGMTMEFDAIDDYQGKTTADADMKCKSFYATTMGWDMTNDWKFIKVGEYPVLVWMDGTTPTQAVEVTSAGYATFVADADIEVPEGVEVFAAQVNGNYAHLEPIEGLIPAGEAVVVKASQNTYSFPYAVEYATAVAGNDLKASTGITADGTQYCLANRTNGVGFYKVGDGVNIPAGKAYLEVVAANAGGAGVKTFYGFEEDDATGISLTPALSSREGEIFNLAGQRMSKAQKGINIINGKKILK